MQVLIVKLRVRVTHDHNTHDYIIGSGLVTIQPQSVVDSNKRLTQSENE